MADYERRRIFFQPSGSFTFDVCQRCGLIAGDGEIHDEYHREMEKLEERVSELESQLDTTLVCPECQVVCATNDEYMSHAEFGCN